MPWKRHLCWRTTLRQQSSELFHVKTNIDCVTAQQVRTSKTSTNRYLVIFIEYVILMIVTTISQCLAECPDPCHCKWKSGKETVDCNRAGFMIVPDGIDKGTQVLYLNHNNLQVLPKDTFLDVKLSNLQRIYMVECSLSQIDREAFRSLSNLVELDISSNHMTYIPTLALREVAQLRRLLMTRNPLKQLIAGSFVGVNFLETLELTQCDIESVEVGAFDGLTRLTLLKLDSNKLQTISDSMVTPIVNLNEFHLHGNPWTCDCHLKSLRSWMLKNNVPFQVPPTCSLPVRLRGRTWKELQLEDYVCEPQIFVESDAAEYSEGDNATLICHVTANPEPSVWWAWQGQPIGLPSNVSTSEGGVSLDHDTFQVTEDGNEHEKVSRLSIVYTEKSNSGTYACMAENGVSVTMANLTLKVGREQVAEIKSGGGGSLLVVSHITGIIVGITLVILLLVAILCFFTMRCKHNTPIKLEQHKYSDSNHVINRCTTDELVNLEEQDLSLLGPNPIQKPPRLGQYHGVPTMDMDHLDHYESGVGVDYTPNSISPNWNTQAQVVIEFDPKPSEGKCLRRAVEQQEVQRLTVFNDSDLVDTDDKSVIIKDTSLRPIVEEMVNGRESEEGDDSGLELDRCRETELRGGFSDQDSDRERLKEKNRRNQEKRTPLCPRDPSAIERELIGLVGCIGVGSGRDKPRRPLVFRGSTGGGGGGGGGDSTCSSSDPPTVPSSPQRQSIQQQSSIERISSPSLTKLFRTGRPATLNVNGENGTEV